MIAVKCHRIWRLLFTNFIFMAWSFVANVKTFENPLVPHLSWKIKFFSLDLCQWRGDISFSRLIYGRTAYLCIISLVYPDQTSITRQSEIHITGLAPLPQSMTAPHPFFLIGLFLIRCRHSDHTTPPICRLVC